MRQPACHWPCVAEIADFVSRPGSDRQEIGVGLGLWFFPSPDRLPSRAARARLARPPEVIPIAAYGPIIGAGASDVARFDVIDRRTFGACSRIDAILYTCHPRLVNGYLQSIVSALTRQAAGRIRARPVAPSARPA